MIGGYHSAKSIIAPSVSDPALRIPKGSQWEFLKVGHLITYEMKDVEMDMRGERSSPVPSKVEMKAVWKNKSQKKKRKKHSNPKS